MRLKASPLESEVVALSTGGDPVGPALPSGPTASRFLAKDRLDCSPVCGEPDLVLVAPVLGIQGPASHHRVARGGMRGCHEEQRDEE